MEDSFESGASTEGTSADSSSSPATDTQEASSHEGNETSNTEKNLPFNDPNNPVHPRFQELIEQNRGYKTQLSEFEQRLQKMQSDTQAERQEYQQALQQFRQQQQPQVKPFGPLLERLRGIDPEFAEAQQRLIDASEELPSVRQELQSLRIERDRAKVDQSINSLYEQFKVPEDRREDYQMYLKAAAYENPKLGIKDIPNLFKQAHEVYSKKYDSIERKIRSSYVADKKKDATPASQSGGTPTGGPAQKPMSRIDAVKELAQAMRQSRNKI